ncbi:MarR family winged helix-turn-helix transcriptional regulator [Agromyces subbeticus]|uniref:MarR family winged helix-turn-helix transcriptional regulator n=1 Tax=Agromyces subbeticus TaxID=293890 RepID=UPI0003B4CB27|nr:MarR family transcriptional regulator [Agromyces subbeticus]
MGVLPDDLACFAVHVAARELDNAYRPALRELGLTYPQYMTMLVLWERDPQTVKELGAALRFDSGTLSPLLKRLEAAGFVTRERSTTDERSVLVRLTTRGRKLEERGKDLVAKVFRTFHYSDRDAEHLHEEMRKLVAALDDRAATFGRGAGG